MLDIWKQFCLSGHCVYLVAQYRRILFIRNTSNPLSNTWLHTEIALLQSQCFISRYTHRYRPVLHAEPHIPQRVDCETSTGINDIPYNSNTLNVVESEHQPYGRRTQNIA